MSTSLSRFFISSFSHMPGSFSRHVAASCKGQYIGQRGPVAGHRLLQLSGQQSGSVAQGSLQIQVQRTAIAPAHPAGIEVALVGDAVLVGHSATGQGGSQRQCASAGARGNTACMPPLTTSPR